MNALEKIREVDFRIEDLIPEEDIDFCKRHQSAYDGARAFYLSTYQSYQKAVRNQKDKISSYFQYPESYHHEIYVGRLGKLSAKDIGDALYECNLTFGSEIMEYFKDKYQLTSLQVCEEGIIGGLISEVFALNGTYNYYKGGYFIYQQLLDVHLIWQDVYRYIAAKVGSNVFTDAAISMLKSECLEISEYSVKGTRLELQSANTGGYLKDSTMALLKAVFHMENGHINYPDGFCENLTFYFSGTNNQLNFNLKSLEYIRLFQNGRVDINFTSQEMLNQFVTGYLGIQSKS